MKNSTARVMAEVRRTATRKYRGPELIGEVKWAGGYAEVMESALHDTLTPERLEELAGPVVFGRGENLMDMVVIQDNSVHRLSGTVQGSKLYRVEFSFSAGRTRAGCTCPYFDRGHICKHLVALGLAAGEDIEPSFADPEEDPAETTYLLNAERGELLRLLDYARALSPEFADYLRQQVAAREGSDKEVEAHVKDAITQAGRVGGHISYDRAQDVAESLAQVVELLTGYVQAGRSTAVVRQSRRLVDRTATILERADDSYGLIGDVLFEAVALHTRVCLEAPADPGKLVDWILKIQVSGPGWPDLAISDYQPILDDKARARYRRGLEDALAAAEPGWRSSTLRGFLVELADLEGNLDEAVALLLADARRAAALRRLDEAGREQEADELFLDLVASWRPRDGRSLAAADVVQRLLDTGRAARAADFSRQVLRQSATADHYELLVRVGRHQGRDYRETGWQIARGVLADPETKGWGRTHVKAEMVKMAIVDDDPAKVKELVAESTYLGDQEAAIGYFQDSDPAYARELLLALASSAAAGAADKRNYHSAANYLVRARRLNTEAEQVTATISRLRARYSNRPSMLKIFDAAGLR